ncbi:hypothetical protein [Fictibacillus phosphorivorans]|uniref:hypothetical protein n=1 Tax=Fictibacillus phosphorivorans TaxID=1221500 RepID=UPI00203E9DA0|nr:hypothetical protein [Fictibacillus phosphorivorans]MCM3717711.1 hypothetical protein [Fictibacillus phosphorivorans]MCM3775611.1 hypothetical protein [Fictibacillus phosphorivorans]
MRAGNIYQYKHMSKFQSVGEFNHHKDIFLQHHPDLFTRSEYIAFEVLTQYSVVVPGVANAKIATLVSACTTRQGGISRATFVRMLRKAKSAGFLKVHKTYRSNGGFAHNVFVFQPIDIPDETQMTHREYNEIPSESRVEPTISSAESINLFSNLEKKDLNIRQEENVKLTTQPSWISPHLQDLDYTFVPDNVPREFIQTVRPFFDRATEIYTFWHKALTAYKKFNFQTPIEQLTYIVIEAFKTTVFLYKQRKIKTSFTQYFYGTLSGMFSTEKRREHAAFRLRPDYNWLEK